MQRLKPPKNLVHGRTTLMLMQGTPLLTHFAKTTPHCFGDTGTESFFFLCDWARWGVSASLTKQRVWSCSIWSASALQALPGPTPTSRRGRLQFRRDATSRRAADGDPRTLTPSRVGTDVSHTFDMRLLFSHCLSRFRLFLSCCAESLIFGVFACTHPHATSRVQLRMHWSTHLRMQRNSGTVALFTRRRSP